MKQKPKPPPPCLVVLARALDRFGTPEFEHRFDQTRRWRFDMAWPQHWVAFEREGDCKYAGIYSRRRASNMCGQDGCYQHPSALTSNHPRVNEGKSMATPQSTVMYRDIPNFDGYRVGDDGSVWSRWIKVGLGAGGGTTRKIGGKWNRLKPWVRDDGHLDINLGSRFRFRVHTLILIAFVGPRPKGAECCHSDGNPGNNSLGNLRWDTRKANCADAKVHGTAAVGERNGQSKLTTEMVRSIRADRRSGMTYAELANKYGVKAGTLHPLISGKTWKHVTEGVQ